MRISDWSSDVCSSDLAIEEMNRSSQSTILKKIDELFGERFGQEERRILKDRYDRRNTSGGDLLIKPGSGTIYAPAIAVSKPEAQPIPQHRFHQTGRATCRGKSVSVRVDLGVRRIIKKKTIMT